MRRIYLDNAATTPCDPRVVEVMLPFFSERFGNPASRTHPFGWEADEAVELAREEIAALIHADPGEIHFTSGATESNNLALKGILRSRGPSAHLVVSAAEHSSVLEPARALADEGFGLTVLPVDPDGRVDPIDLSLAIRPETALVSIMHANNETGLLQDLPALSRVCRERGVLFHTDAVQSLGKVPLTVKDAGCDLLSGSAHKIHGPKGSGVLFVRRRVRPGLKPLFEGGGQERGVRSGTLNVPAIVGFGAACRLAREEGEEEGARIARLRDRLESGILEGIPGAVRNGPAGPRVPGIANLRIPGIPVEALVLALRSTAFSSGSACDSGSTEPSHVLLALGLDEESARNSLRFSVGRFNTAEEIEIVLQELHAAVRSLREMP